MTDQDARSLPPQAQEALRPRIADFLKKHKGTQKEAAAIFQVSLRGVEKIWKQYKDGGRKALKQKKRGPTRGPRPAFRKQSKADPRHHQKGYARPASHSPLFVDGGCGAPAD